MRNAWNLTETYRFFTISILAIILLSCSNVQERKKPDYLLSKQQMIEIYTDMLLLDAINRTNIKKFQSLGLETSQHIYNKFDIDSITLAENMNYYNLDFETNAEIYKQVRLNIEKRKEYMDSLTKRRDSLKKLEKKEREIQINESLKHSIKIDTTQNN